MIKNEKVYFNQSIFYLFNHINTRSDIFLPKQIKLFLEELHPKALRHISLDKSQYTFIELQGLPTTEIADDQNPGSYICQIIGMEELTIQEYFEKWEKLIIELQKFV